MSSQVLEERRISGKSERQGLYPPPFLGPAPHTDILGYQDRHGTSNGHNQDQHQPAKAKKSLAEKISRTLDKIAAVTTNPVGYNRDGDTRHVRTRVGAGPANVVYPVYAGYSPGYRTVRGPHGMSYQYVYTGWGDTATPPGPAPGLYHHEYHGHYYPANTFCRCPNSGSESVRTKAGTSKCKKCSKPKTPYIQQQHRPGGGGGGTVSGGGKVRARLQLPPDASSYQSSPRANSRDNSSKGQQQQQVPVTGPKDPYDYIRRTRLKADDWDTYWEKSEMTPNVATSTSQSPNINKTALSHRNENKFIKHSRSSPSPEARRVVSQFDPRNLNHVKSLDLNKNERIETVDKRSSSSDNRRQPLDIRVTVCDLMEDEDSNQPESKPISNSEPGVKNSNSDSQGQSEKNTKDTSSILDSFPTKNNMTSEDELDADSGLSASLLADMATMKSKISVAEMRYRKFQRRNPLRKLSLQIDDVIMEEDEEALENEEQDYQSINSSSLPPVLEEASNSSDDEFGIGKYKHVIGDSNFADEILSEIYGATGPGNGNQRKDDDENAGESLGEEKEEDGIYDGNRSLADEILDELYGSTTNPANDEEDIRESTMSPEYCNIDDIRPTSDNHHAQVQGNQDDFQSVVRNGENFIGAEAQNYHVIGSSTATTAKTRLSRSASLQEKSGGGLGQMLLDTTRFKLSQRPSLLNLFQHEDQSLYEAIPELPGTPTLHRPTIPPPPPPSNHPLLQPFNSLELSRINNVIKSNDLSASNGDDFSGSEFSDDEFDDPIDIDYENIPVAERLPPEGAEAESEYDVPELNESFEHAPPEGIEDAHVKCDKDVADLDTSFSSSTCIADISADSLMPIRIADTSLDISFDRDSIEFDDSLRSSHNTGSVIQNHGEKTIILSPAVALSKCVGESQAESKIFISSSSWINIDGQSDSKANINIKEDNIIDNNRVTIINGSAGANENIADMTEQTPAETQEPVKPPRLKKLARQQSKQEMLRAKGFGVTGTANVSSGSDGGPSPGDMAKKVIKGLNNNINNNKSRPEISSPILINSTFNSEDFQKHKCITINRSDVPFLLHAMSGMESESEIGSVYRANSSDTDSSFYNPESVLDDTYNNSEAAASDIYSEHIYEEIPENGNKVRPLPPIPEAGSTNNISSKSIFTGATKYEILHYLNDAKQRIEGNVVDFETINEDTERDTEIQSFLGNRNHKHRVSAISNVSDSSNSSHDSSGSGDGSVLYRGPLEKIAGRVEIERNDSGVGSDSGMSSCNKPTNVCEAVPGCEDCEVTLTDDNESLCSKCIKRRGERKEIITEIVDTEIKYGRDLRIIVEEFYRPMLVAGLLSSDQLASIFLNVEQLIQVNTSFTEKLKEAIDETSATGDEDLLSVQIGALFINAMPMLQAFEAYCTKQAASSMLLANVEREKELLRVFLKVSQMENKILRRMNLSSFLMVPVQRVTKYPLLLARLLKVTPGHHKDRENIREAQSRIEAALEQINKDAKEIIAMKGSWKRGGQTNKKMGLQREMNNMRVRKLSLEMLGWNREDTRFALEGRLTFAQVSDSNWKTKLKGTVNSGVKLLTANALLVVTSKPGYALNTNMNHGGSNGSGTPGAADLPTNNNIIFPKLDTIGDAVLLLIREKTSRFATVRDPFFLEKTIICCDQDWEQEYFEIHEFGSKDSYIFKAEDSRMTSTWFQALQFYSQCLGGWRRRRKGLGNIMVDPSLN